VALLRAAAAALISPGVGFLLSGSAGVVCLCGELDCGVLDGLNEQLST
jgi:hypothetical protein